MAVGLTKVRRVVESRRDEFRLDHDRADQRDLGAVREEWAADALIPDLVGQLGLIDPVVAALLEKVGDVGQREDRFDLEFLRGIDASLDQPSPDPLTMGPFGNGQAFQLREVIPEHMQGCAADDLTAGVSRYEKLADRLVKFAQ